MGKTLSTLVLLLSMSACAFPAGDMGLSGTWKLNIAKSKWGKKEKPASGMLQIEERPKDILVSGTVTHGGEESGNFSYTGVLDGKPRPAGSGAVTLKQIAPDTIESVWRSGDSRYTETSRTTISKDKKHLSRTVDLKRPDGEVRWTEVWDRE